MPLPFDNLYNMQWLIRNGLSLMSADIGWVTNSLNTSELSNNNHLTFGQDYSNINCFVDKIYNRNYIDDLNIGYLFEYY